MIALDMRAQSLRGFLGLAGVLGMLGAACSSTPARVAAPPAPPAKKEVVEVKEPEPPPEPLATADVAFEQKWDFVKLSLMDVRSDSDFMPEDEIVKKLPSAQRFEYQSVQRARKQLLATEERMNAARRGMYKAGKAGVAQYKLTLVARGKARAAVVKAVAKAEQSVTQAMDKKPSAELGLALARLRTSHPEAQYNDRSRTLAYGFTETSSDSASAIEPLRKAAALTALDSTGRYARFELIHHLMATADAKDAKPYINELLGVVAWDKKPLLLLRLGVLQSLEKQDALAAETFRSAHEHLATSSGVDRKTLLMAEVAARYRAQQFDRVLIVAEEHWNEWGDPKTVKPDPNPPPPPPPAPKVKAKSASSAVHAAGILGVLNSSNYSVLGSLGSQSFSDADVLRFATDAAERQSLDPAQMKGTPAFLAGIASRLAARAFYRNDDGAAKAAGETAKSLGGSASREGLRVLKALAKRSNDTQALTEIDDALTKASYGRGAHASGIEHAYLDEELREKKSADEKPSTTPVVERNIRSLVRLCLEPTYQRLPEKSELVVSAKVFPDGKVEPLVEAGGGSDVSACLKQMASRVLAHAPSSVSAKVAVARLDPERQSIWGGGFGSIFGDSIGESFGAGGLGLSGIGVGGGGSGDSIGLGSVGGIGWGTGGIGRGGGGQLGGKVKKKPSPKKPITVPKK